MIKISHSGQELYNSCPRKYKHRYIDRLRGLKIPSPLFFGGALDEAFSHLLLSKKEELTELELSQCLTKTAEEVFQDKMLLVEHNGNTVSLSQSPFAEYFASDFSPELLKKEHLAGLNELEPAYSLVNFIDFHQECKEQISARKKLLPDDQVLYNYCSWLSMVEKGKLMVNAYRNDIIPQVGRVFDIQKKISIKNEDGDEIRGLIDFTASFTGSDEKYIIDNKTSSKPYKAESVKESAQLSTYCHAEGTNKAAYIVIEKKLYKKVPFIRTQVIKDCIPVETFDKTLDNFQNVCHNIESGKFQQNWDSCFAFGRMCEYYQLCKYNKMDTLVQMPEKDESKV